MCPPPCLGVSLRIKGSGVLLLGLHGPQVHIPQVETWGVPHAHKLGGGCFHDCMQMGAGVQKGGCPFPLHAPPHFSASPCMQTMGGHFQVCVWPPTHMCYILAQDTYLLRVRQHVTNGSMQSRAG